jgi:alkylation response protein AidB-like acyl-CoA dehydrogenase
MADYVPPIEDMRFLLSEVFDFDRQMAELYPDLGFDAELGAAVLEEAGRFCSEVLAPLNRPADEEGCRLENGVVVTPKGVREAYEAFREAGWPAVSGDPEFGGQGLPRAVQLLIDEMISASNMSFGLFPGLTHGAVEALARHASPELKAAYLPRMISGEWTGVMALTEASAGTDLGLLKTQAAPQGDGGYRITGTKIFISSGDQDFGGNIIHLVLARLPDAPAGVKGISLFLVPKFLPNEDGGLGERNNLSVGALEHKMGIHAQPTCVMNYDGAVGWLVGEPHRGLAAMFTMMNNERLFVGVQGLGLADGAYQKAAAYAKERLQGRSADGARGPVPIIEHPDVRRMLLSARAFVESARALAVWTAMQMDIAGRHPDPEVRADAEGLLALLTPVVKAAFTDFGFEATVQAQQVFGGHGYIREWGVEQYVRDARITQIYEGTNGVQAADLAGRKLAMEGGRLPERFFALVAADLEAAARVEAAAGIAAPVLAALEDLRAVTQALQSRSNHPAEIGAAASDYLRLFALVALGWMWTRIAYAAVRGEDGPRRAARLAVARFFVDRMLPQTLGLAASIAAGSALVMALDEAAF